MVKDWWGRTVLTHAVESERTRVFETVFYAVKGQILDFEVRGTFLYVYIDRWMELTRLLWFSLLVHVSTVYFCTI